LFKDFLMEHWAWPLALSGCPVWLIEFEVGRWKLSVE
jgi:hypothetical protein